MEGRFNWAGVIDFLPELGTGLYYTLLISIIGLIIGFVLGAIFGLGRISKIKYFMVFHPYILKSSEGHLYLYKQFGFSLRYH